jgi:hypothetical protein
VTGVQIGCIVLIAPFAAQCGRLISDSTASGMRLRP